MMILLAPMGTSGDVDPYVGLGGATEHRGHRVTAVLSTPTSRTW